jgi:SAM-dependent MidA family methyltransferase
MVGGAILDELRRRGCPVTFAEYMELALYHPTAGYYTRERPGAGPVGPDGDFVTAPTASLLLARTLARLLSGLAGETVRDEPLTFVELGAGEGYGLGALLEASGTSWSGRVCAVERSAAAREHLIGRCRQGGRGAVEAVAEVAELVPSSGPVVMFSSELYDALPCHRVTAVAGAAGQQLAEMLVAVGEGGRLTWQVAEECPEKLDAYLASRGVSLEIGQKAEVRPDLVAAHRQHLGWCGRNALAITLDYGYPARSLYNARGRPEGTLVGYRKHTMVTDVLESPGEIDITAHVNFDDLIEAGTELGWSSLRAEGLGMFLARNGALELLPIAGAGEQLTPAQMNELAAAKRVLLPGMGSDLKVVVQGIGPLWEAYCKLVRQPSL